MSPMPLSIKSLSIYLNPYLFFDMSGNDQLLSMFFDEEFVPHAYLDAYFSSLIENNSKSSSTNYLTSINSLNLLQNKSSLLLSHLDFYTNELTNDLKSTIKNLSNSNSIISYSYEADQNSKLKGTSRLEYYVDSLSISIRSLDEDVSRISNEIDQLAKSSDGSSAINRLIELDSAKKNLEKVLNTLETVKAIVDIESDVIKQDNRTVAPTSAKSSKFKDVTVSPIEFQKSLDDLKDLIKEQFKTKSSIESSKQIDHHLLNKVETMINLLHVFKNLPKFYPIFSNFVKVLTTEKQNYLNTKNIDENDELFNSILN